MNPNSSTYAGVSTKSAASRVLSSAVYYGRRALGVRDKGTRILCYHKVNDTDRDYLTISVKKFEEQIAFLKMEGYRNATLADLIEGRAGSRSIIITFDDGYRDNYENAFPILQKYGFTGIIFCVAGEMGKGIYLRKEDAAEMRAAGMEFGAHTLTHAKLNELDRQVKWSEIQGSKQRLKEWLGFEVDFFCYPYGIYDAEALQLVREAGYRAAVSNIPGSNTGWERKRGSSPNPHLLKRTEIASSDSLGDFKKKMAGAYDVLHAALHTLRGRP